MRLLTYGLVVACVIFSGCNQEKPILELTEKYGLDGKKASVVIYKNGGQLVVPESGGRKPITYQVFDVRENNGAAGDKLIAFRLGKPDAAPLTFSGGLGVYGCIGCEIFGLSNEWVAVKRNDSQ